MERINTEAVSYHTVHYGGSKEVTWQQCKNTQGEGAGPAGPIVAGVRAARACPAWR
jgi:hypothetical protein